MFKQIKEQLTIITQNYPINQKDRNWLYYYDNLFWLLRQKGFNYQINF